MLPSVKNQNESAKRAPLRILSLDGGGVRGYSMLIIIQELMHKTYVELEGKAPRPSNIPKPCDHFDLIVGTGTGGLIAVLLGRLRLDLETCKALYSHLTRYVFQTDKTLAGIPYRSTLFKASKLEEAIKEAVREHTISEKDENSARSSFASNFATSQAPYVGVQRHFSNASVVSFSARPAHAQFPNSLPFHGGRGNPDARLYDDRKNRTKTWVSNLPTWSKHEQLIYLLKLQHFDGLKPDLQFPHEYALTAIYRGSARGSPPALLRSYDSRTEISPEHDCKIWEAGRATCAIAVAFKPVRVGQSIFHDDGAGTFNPAPHALREAVNEWPGHEIGVFVSVGTGKRPPSTGIDQSQWYEGFLGEFAEARRRLISKIENCEQIHHDMLSNHLPKYGVSLDNYYRLNVEVGVGEFAMNEWFRLSDISTGTKRYLSRPLESNMLQDASRKLAKIYQDIHNDTPQTVGQPTYSPSSAQKFSTPSHDMPTAVELPGEGPSHFTASHSSEGLTTSKSVNSYPVHSAPVPSKSTFGQPFTDQGAALQTHYQEEGPPATVDTTAKNAAVATSVSNIKKVASSSHSRFYILPPRLPPRTPSVDQLPVFQGTRQSEHTLGDQSPPRVNMSRKPIYGE